MKFITRALMRLHAEYLCAVLVIWRWKTESHVSRGMESRLENSL